MHGDLPLTQEIFREAGVACYPMAGKTYEVKKGERQESEEFIPNFELLLTKLNELEQDMPLATFLETFFADEAHRPLREGVIKFAEGYDAADIRKVSVLALREEWLSGGATNSFFPKGGYGQVMDFLAAEVQAAGGQIKLNCEIREVRWGTAQSEIIAADGQQYLATKVLITVPLGVLLAPAGDQGHIRFSPPIHEKKAALEVIGFGPVIKILLEFKTAFWDDPALKEQAHQMPDLSFLLSDADPVPTWWTHAPNKTPLLTGWLAGPAALALQHLPDEALVTQALESLGYIFSTCTAFLRQHLQASLVCNWVADPFARGAYAYATVASGEARHALAQPEQDVLFFAGEACYQGHAMGTVEAALASGKETAQQIIASAAR